MEKAHRRRVPQSKSVVNTPVIEHHEVGVGVSGFLIASAMQTQQQPSDLLVVVTKMRRTFQTQDTKSHQTKAAKFLKLNWTWGGFLKC